MLLCIHQRTQHLPRDGVSGTQATSGKDSDRFQSVLMVPHSYGCVLSSIAAVDDMSILLQQLVPLVILFLEVLAEFGAEMPDHFRCGCYYLTVKQQWQLQQRQYDHHHQHHHCHHHYHHCPPPLVTAFKLQTA
jgi:hypothetical protein